MGSRGKSSWSSNSSALREAFPNPVTHMADLDTTERAAPARPHADTRLEAFCDGVFAIALTLLILEVSLGSTESITSSTQLWRALGRLTPSILAFVLSFGIIFITWVNHRALLKLVHGSSPAFLYANGFLLLTVVTLPFPTGMLGEFLGTDHASPAVVLYNAVLSVQAIGWILVSGAALGNRLTTGASAVATMRESNRNGYFAFVLYGLLSIAAFWFPLTVVTITTLSWLFWLSLGIRMKQA